MKTIAAVLVETGKPLELAELEIPRLKPGQVLVEIVFSGVCHTQLQEVRGYRGEDKFLPHCLGHEAGGIVQEIGPGVMKVKPGDRVILSWIKGLGTNVPGTVYDWGERKVNSGAVTTFSQYSVVSENRLTPMPNGLSMEDSPLLGCAAPTGIGAVLNAAKSGPGQSIAVFGTGGVGLCSIIGAALSSCVPIIAIDLLESKLELAAKLGATHFINAASGNPVELLESICPGGVDFCIEASGSPEAMRQSLQSVRPQGGTTVIIGNARQGETLSIDPGQLNMGKRMLGTWGGDCNPDVDFPRLAKLVTSGRINLKPLTTKKYSLQQVNQALNDLEAGLAARPIIDMTE